VTNHHLTADRLSNHFSPNRKGSIVKFNVFVLPTVPGTPEERAALRPIGRNRERVGQMYEEIIEICQVAEDLGFESFSTTEHHFHSEGFE